MIKATINIKHTEKTMFKNFLCKIIVMHINNTACKTPAKKLCDYIFIFLNSIPKNPFEMFKMYYS